MSTDDLLSHNGRTHADRQGVANGTALSVTPDHVAGLRFESVELQYGRRVAVHSVTFSLQPGEVLALIGPNGAGKSTLIRAATGSKVPSSGRITVGGMELHHLPTDRRARLVAVVPQAVRLPEAFTAFDTVLMGRTAYLGWLGRESRADREAARLAMEQTSTLELAQRTIGELSGGEQQRVLIARAVAQAAPILLMDEPTAHLDLKHQVGTLGLVRDLAHSGGRAVLIALHDLNLAAQYADRVALLVDGRLEALGCPIEVLKAEILSQAYGLPIHVLALAGQPNPWVIAGAVHMNGSTPNTV